MVAICATSPGRAAAPCWCSSCPMPDAGVRLNEHIEDVDGAVVFRQACVMGLEGIVAKRRDSRYRSGRCREWNKVKNPAHPAIQLGAGSGPLPGRSVGALPTPIPCADRLKQ